MMFTNFIVATTVVIAATSNFGAHGFPRPQLNIKVGSTNLLSLDPLGILFGRPTSESPTVTVPPTFPPIVTQNRPTQSPVVDPTSVPSSTQPDVAICARNCKVTSQYNPVCGSNGVMYNNAELLICTRNCGISVTELHTGRCTPPAPTVTPNPPTPGPATQQPDTIQCLRNCIVTSEYNPVCGSDNLVYNNPGMLICARNCGISVTQLHTGRCSSSLPTVTVGVTPSPPSPAPATLLPDAARCAQSCMLTQEYNPVCGSDLVTYRNAGLLICTRNCGINVTQRSFGPCLIKDPFLIDPRTGRD